MKVTIPRIREQEGFDGVKIEVEPKIGDEIPLMKDDFKIKSRIEILDELAVKLSQDDLVDSFADYLSMYNDEAVTRLVMIAMNHIELQGMKIERRKYTGG